MGVIVSCAATSFVRGDPAKLKRRSDDFAVVFQMGYAGDHFPRDRKEFEMAIVAAKEAHYNVVLCKHEDWREELCRKHGLKMMVDLLVADHHVYKNTEGAKALCESLRESDTIYAYHLWSDKFGGTAAGRSRDIANVHKWDPNHAAYVGDYGAREIGGVEDPDLVGYYDFHWKRGGHWRHLQRACEAAMKTNSFFLKYADGAPGKVGVGNYNRVLYTISMSLAHGLKGYTFHHTGGEIDKKTWEWKTLGGDLAKVNAEVALLGPELMKIGNPTAVYSTPITKTAKDRPTGDENPTVPPELEAIPGDYWMQVEAGEAVVGVFKEGKGRDALLFANHNSYQPQAMKLAFQAPVKGVARFDRKGGAWKRLTVSGGTVEFELPPAAPELLLVLR